MSTRPIPEFLKGDKGLRWKVQENRHGGGYCSPGQRILSVPTGDECVLCGEEHDQAIRTHEFVHAAITAGPNNENPRLPDGLELDYFQVAEDMRVYRTIDSAYQAENGGETKQAIIQRQCRDLYSNSGNYKSKYDDGKHTGLPMPGYEDDYFLTEKGLAWVKAHPDAVSLPDEWLIQPPVLCSYEREKWEGTVRKMDDKARCLWGLAAGPADQPFVYEIIGKYLDGTGNLGIDMEMFHRIKDQAYGILAETDSRWPTLQDAVRTAQFLQRIFDKLEDPTEEESGEESGDGEVGYEDGNGNPVDEDGNPISETPLSSEPEGGTKTRTGKGVRSENFGQGQGEWAEMTIEYAPMPVSLPGYLRRTHKQNDQGGAVNQVFRWKMDRKIYRHTKKIPGGTVLVDDSGSMNLPYETLYAIVENAPGATVALYSGSGYHGTLKIVAEKGRICVPEDCTTEDGGNQIDGPALEWLNSMEGPRIWISDGQVVGVHGQTQECLLHRDILLRKGRCTWIDVNFIGKGADALTSATLRALQKGR